jgi:hypothetical protein
MGRFPEKLKLPVGQVGNSAAPIPSWEGQGWVNHGNEKTYS